MEAAAALLDPVEPDGRAVEPILRALDVAHGRRSERIALAVLLGRTGVPRAAPILVAMGRDTADPGTRFAAIQALGSLDPPVRTGCSSTRSVTLAPKFAWRRPFPSEMRDPRGAREPF